MSGNVALIWGAAGGIGRALTERLVTTEGWQVVAAGRHVETLTGLASQAYEADVANPFDVQRAVAAAAQEAGEANLFIYAAGDITSEPVARMTPEAWARIVGANLTGAYLTLHYSLPLLAADAPLVLVGAVSERLRLPGLSAYAAAKAGLEAFADALRKEERRRRVILVRPGAVETPLWRKVPFRMPANALSPAALADRVLAAVREGYSGTLDL